MKMKRVTEQEQWTIPHCYICGYDISAGDLVVEDNPYSVRHATSQEAGGEHIKYGLVCQGHAIRHTPYVGRSHSEALAECSREGLDIIL